jgi:ComF family protein
MSRLRSLWPAPACPLCQSQPTTAPLPCCSACWQDLPWRQQNLQLPDIPVRVACAYQWPLDRLIHLFKYQEQLQFLPVLTAILATQPRPAVTAIAAVPLSAQRLRERGYNQCQLLAQQLSRHWGIPLWSGLQRIRHTDRQQQLNAQQRLHNLSDAFAFTDPPTAPARILLIDDVLTTGSTLSELARLLSRHGIAAEGLVLASNH